MGSIFSGCLNPDFKKPLSIRQGSFEISAETQQVPMERGYCPPQTVQGFCMRIMHGEEYGKLYQLSEFATHGCRILTIGREPDNLLPVTERQSTYVSRHHCTLETTLFR